MIWNIIMMLLYLMGFDDNKPKYDLHKKQEGIKLNEAQFILILFVLFIVFFGIIFIFCGHCTDSGVFYNSNLY